MSVIFGLFYKNGRPVADELQAMYEGMRHFPHERHAFAVQGGCGLGHMLTYNTPEAVHEHMPRRIDAAGLLFAAEGRLDNRAELFSALDVPASERADMPDGDILLKAYLRWGEGCVNRLTGKWSLAAFHTREQRLFLARDKWDFSDIQYFEDDQVIAFATTEKGLFPLPFLKKEINERKLAMMLILWRGEYESSLFKGIRYLLPSHTLRATREKTELRRYWSYADIPVNPGKPLAYYTEALLDALEQAVKARLRSCRPVAATLSGGLDSGTVCILAAQQLAKRQERLRTYSHVPHFAPTAALPKHRFGDERPMIQSVVKAAGNIDPVFLDSAGISPLAGLREARRLYGETFFGVTNAYWLAELFQTAAKEQFGTVLMGTFGNTTISWRGTADALPAGELFKRYGIKRTAQGKLIHPVLYGDTPLAPLYRRLRCGARPWKDRSYCTKAFEESVQLAQEIKKSGIDPDFPRYFADPRQYRAQLLDKGALRLSLNTALGCATGLELRDPTGDPRVIESALSIPDAMFFGETDKWVLRTMMKNRLPDAVRLQEKKGSQSADLPMRLDAHRGEMDAVLAEMQASSFGRIADVERMAADWNALKTDSAWFPLRQTAMLLLHVNAYQLYRTL